MSTDRPPIHERIRQYVDDIAQLSRKQVALNLGVSESKLSLMLAGKRKITVDEYENICAVLAVKPSRFLSAEQQT